MPPGQRPQDAWKGGSAAPARPGLPRTKQAPPANRWFKAAFLLAALIGVIAGLVYFLGRGQPTRLVVVSIDQYKHPDWSPNAWAAADAAGVAAVFPNNSDAVVQVQEREIILGKLDDAMKPGPRWKGESPVVVYFCALGTVIDGKVYLLPADANPSEEKSWIELEALFKPFIGAPAKKLLVLDVRPARSPRAVLPAEDVSDVLDRTLAEQSEKGVLPFFVLSANPPCDGPNVLRPLKRSLFGLAFTHGVAGAADGWGGAPADNRITARELAAYVCEVTNRLSQGPGFAEQLPRLYGKADDFELHTVPRNFKPTLPELKPAEESRLEPPKAVIESWKTLDAWTGGEKHLHRRAPRLTCNFAEIALRAEQRAMAGQPADVVEKDFLAKAKLLRDVEPQIVPIAPLVRSVARVRQRPAVAKEAEKLESTLAPRFAKLPAPTKSDKSMAGLPDEWKADIKKAVGKADPDALAVALFDIAQKRLGNPTIAQFQALAFVAADHDLHHVELATITLVAALPDEQVEKRWPMGTPRQLLEAVRTSEEVVAVDGRVLPRVRSRLEANDRARREIVQTLANPNSKNEDYDRAAKQLAGVIVDSASLRDVAVALAAGWNEYEETRATLADFALRFPIPRESDGKAVADGWSVLVDHYRKLESVLGAAGETEPPTADAATKARQNLYTQRLALAGLLPKPASLNEVRALERALLWPRWTAAERADLTARLEAAHRATTEKALADWPTHSHGRPLTIDRNCSADVQRVSQRELRRIVDLLTLARWEKADELRANSGNLDAAVVRRVRTAYRETLKKDYLAAVPPRQALFGWCVDVEELPAYPEPSSAVERNPEWIERRRAEREFHGWLAAQRYRADAAGMTDLSTKVPQTQAYAAERAVILDYARTIGRIADDFEHANP